jgi:cell division protein FtsQ
VAADGTVLGPAWLSTSLPVVTGSVEPPASAHLHEVSALAAVAVLGAAPAPLGRFVARVYNGPEGLTVAMRNGLLVYFGDGTRPHAKWLSLARVLTSPSAAGALYVDVRLPERPAAGSSSSSSSSASSSASSSSASSASTPVQTSTSNPTSAALAARLSKAAGGESKASSPTSGSEASETSSGSAPASSGESETSSGPSEASTSSGGEAEPMG